MNENESPLETALRGLPREEGSDDWTDLKSRIKRRRPFSVRLRKHAGSLRWAMACLCILVGIGFWQSTQGRQSAIASQSLELRTWVAAHDQAVDTDPYADPWAQSIAEAGQ